MNKFFVVVALAVVAASHSMAETPREAIKSVVAVLPDWPDPSSELALKEPEGLAVCILDGGYFAPAPHVLGRAKTLNVRLAIGTVKIAHILARDVLADIALLKVD